MQIKAELVFRTTDALNAYCRSFFAVHDDTPLMVAILKPSRIDLKS